MENLTLAKQQELFADLAHKRGLVYTPKGQNAKTDSIVRECNRRINQIFALHHENGAPLETCLAQAAAERDRATHRISTIKGIELSRQKKETIA